ncbi:MULTISPECIES: CBS domain-containing protein [unclassified Herbaspirillum]|jgi:acetoin utilization protein AcuB|uniref:CBS domain-containing protein n=1 Tax=unclassified Herbaspirillum TaxID=2624150 RepID=UPI000E2F971D|nr:MULTISPECIES: CBS domain-containing protein [unclassified Herbaspirillum]RFB70618.1 CBS domain-containing protein [Herbaspirillum sp. 3R-3a1]TFI08861.1 CBS domain-containing protein [Herbaspirillum sp. 3R11]TFI15278.1 CBS domain-containing protein [Herbaspirillum sp. 3R-11]TFI27387.1 CBS domain-containing protein [Herbaspirillum sp. 3C11]
MAGVSIKKIMTVKLVTVTLDDKLETVKEIFDSLKFHHLLVVEEHKLLGVVSDRDLLKALSPNIGSARETYQDIASLNKRVHQIVTRRPIVLQESATVDDAIQAFNTHGISCLPVVDLNFRPVGIVTWRDILKNLRIKPSNPATPANQ